MMFFVLGRIFSLLLDVIAMAQHSDHEKDLKIVLLRQQLRILERKHAYVPHTSRWAKLPVPCEKTVHSIRALWSVPILIVQYACTGSLAHPLIGCGAGMIARVHRVKRGHLPHGTRECFNPRNPPQ
jgi:hypothetical protein